MTKIIFRWLLSIALLYGVYTETGVFTTIALSLVFLASEVPTFKRIWLKYKYGDLYEFFDKMMK